MKSKSVLGLALAMIVAGVLSAGGANEAAAAPGERETGAGPAAAGLRTGEGRLRAATETLLLQHEAQRFVDNMMSGGPPPDGIPSIDAPEFVSAAAAGLDPGEPIIGLEYGGVVRAYPHRILVQHEIVNHEIGGENLAVTYCPLTATGQAFKTGSTTLGVSGRLVNSNLVMYDRDTGSLWPQIGATAVAGERVGESLEEVNVHWTTWGAWLERHPDTEVLSTDTGHVRNYDRDPYGSYNPIGGYYASDRTMFPVMHEDDRYHPKLMVVGARTADRAVFFEMESLARQGRQETEHFIGIYDNALDTARVYDKDGETDRADVSALEQVVTIEAFYFAWNAFYPDSEHPE